MKNILGSFCIAFLLPISAQAMPTTYYLDDPLMHMFGGVTYDMGDSYVTLDITGFDGLFTETWTGLVACDTLCTTTAPKEGNSYGANAILTLSFDIPLFFAGSSDPIGVTYFTDTGIGDTQRAITMTTRFIPTPPQNPNLPVPAPATLALFGLGLASMGWSRRKQT